MPKLVDHDQRRREIVAATWRIIAREGVDAVTMRRLSDELGLSNGALARYFASKADIVGAAFWDAVLATNARFAEAGGHELTGRAAMRAFLHEMFPFDEATRREALIVIPFFDYAQHHPGLQEIWSEFIAIEAPLIGRILDEMVAEGTARADLDRDLAIDFLVTVISGAQANPLLTPAGTSQARLDGLIESVLRSLG